MLNASSSFRYRQSVVIKWLNMNWLATFVACCTFFNTSTYAAPGGLDTTFGTNGVYSFTNAQGWQAPQSAVQSTGKIITVHDCGPQTTADVCVTRLTMDGAALDSTFATSGVFSSGDVAVQEFARSVMIDNNDRIVVSAHCGATSPCVFRLTADGALDGTFGSGGYVRMTSMVTAVQTAQMGDGRIVVIGECFSGHYVFCANRLNADGSQDASFNGGAIRMIDASVSNNQASSLALYPDGRILMTGWCDNGGNAKFCVVRLALNGTLDTTFAGLESSSTPSLPTRLTRAIWWRCNPRVASSSAVIAAPMARNRHTISAPARSPKTARWTRASEAAAQCICQPFNRRYTPTA